MTWVLVFLQLTIDGPMISVVGEYDTMIECFEERELFLEEVYDMMNKPYNLSVHYPPNTQAICISKDFE